jgi:hypothetical protein
MASSAEDTSFIPCDNVLQTFGRTTVYIYPRIKADMSYSKTSNIFMVTKSALEAAGLPHNLVTSGYHSHGSVAG